MELAFLDLIVSWQSQYYHSIHLCRRSSKLYLNWLWKLIYRLSRLKSTFFCFLVLYLKLMVRLGTIFSDFTRRDLLLIIGISDRLRFQALKKHKKFAHSGTILCQVCRSQMIFLVVE